MAGELTRPDPFAELGELRTRFGRMLDELDGRDVTFRPAMDVVRESGNLVVRADVPGFKPEEVKAEIEDNLLTISGEHEESRDEKDKNYVRRERRYGSFSRSMALPPGVDANAIKARIHDGVIELTLPIPEEAKQKRVTTTPTAA
jgi:HSP20 family protein